MITGEKRICKLQVYFNTLSEIGILSFLNQQIFRKTEISTKLMKCASIILSLSTNCKVPFFHKHMKNSLTGILWWVTENHNKLKGL